MPPSPEAANAARPHCIRWHWLLDPPWCGLWYCPLHGFDMRKKRFWCHVSLLGQDDVLWTNVVHLGCRCDGHTVAGLVARLRRSLRSADRDASLLAFPHVEASRPPLMPQPHLHLLVNAGAEPPWGGVGAKVSFFECLDAFPRADVKAWQRVVKPEAMLLYLYQATESHRGLPPECLPPRGLGYRQVYGRVGLRDRRG